ncbi:MAG: flagellar basal body P-ring formation protein FlgA [Salinibacterium sp.]|nr:flagellar basal body P-ring formation protein FlgA [Planctomycetota bacterium]MCB1282442.1 flagellar basal body P-ring formation protein FlgA [Salinibacterium sp.]
MTALPFVVLGMMLGVLSPEDTTIIVTLKSEVYESRGTRLLLGDVATVAVISEPGREASIRARLLRLELARLSPTAGSRSLDHAFVREQLVAAGFAPASIDIDGARTVKVRLKTMRVDARRIEAMVTRHIQDSLGSRAEEARIRLAGVTRPFDVAVGRYRLDLRLEGDPENDQYVGRLLLTLVAVVDGEVVHREPVPVYVRRPIEVVRVIRRVAKGRPLGIDDLELTTTEIDGSIDGLVFDIGSVLGRKALGEFEKGTLLDTRRIQPLTAIRKGDIVTAKVTIGALRIETPCRASHDAAVGEHILLVNIESKKTVQGIVVDARTVDVNPDGRGAQR